MKKILAILATMLPLLSMSPVTMDDLTSGFNIGSNYTSDPDFNGMIGFSEPEVRDMLDYYSTQAEFHHSTDELIGIMRPWYDNYCFAPECIGEPTLFNSDMVLYFVDKYLRGRCTVPYNMIDDNIRTDYSKIRMLIRRDKEFAHDASILQKIVQDGGITGTLKSSFPSETVTDPDNFLSLLYYFGMLTLDRVVFDETRFMIPNQVVREQIYTYILRTYIVELKYAKGSDPESKVQQLRREAIYQANRYAASDLVQSTKGNTTLHKLIAVYHGMDMAVCEEIFD